MKEYLVELSLLVRKYFELSLEELKLGQMQLFINLMAGLIVLSLIGVLFLLVLILLISAVCVYLADFWNSATFGLLGGAGILAFLLIIFRVFSRTLLLTPIKNMITRMITKDS
jgi:hypothetical protein